MLPWMEHARHEPRPTKPEKRGPTSDPAHPQPEAAEVESARLLENDAKETLMREGFDEREITLLADEYIAPPSDIRRNIPARMRCDGAS